MATLMGTLQWDVECRGYDKIAIFGQYLAVFWK